MRSNLTLRVEAGATLLSTATGSGATAASIADAPVVYARRNCLMTPAHAGLVNGGRCIRLKDPLVGWDDCAEWEKLENVVIEGGGTAPLAFSLFFSVSLSPFHLVLVSVYTVCRLQPFLHARTHAQH